MQPRAYHDGATGAPASLLEATPGAANLVEYLAVAAGQDVLILSEFSVDPVVVQAIGASAQARGARVTVMLVEPFSPGGSSGVGPAPSVVAAFKEADVVVSCVWWAEVHTAPLFFTEVKASRARLAAVHQAATVGALATGGRFPPGLFYAIKDKVLERVTDARQIRVRTPLGTDLVFEDVVVDTDNGPLATPGSWSPFPYGGVNWYPGRTSGVAVVEESTVTGVPRAPLRLSFEDNEVVDISGGTEARDLRTFSPSGYYLRHAFVGLNPKVRNKSAPQFEREKHAGAFYFGIDARAAADRSGPGFAHCDCQFDQPTIHVDGQVLVDDGHLVVLDDPEIHEAAQAFGEPRRVLAANPYLW